MKLRSLFTCCTLMLCVAMGTAVLGGEIDTDQEIIDYIDRASQKVPAPKFEIKRIFRTPYRHKEYMDISADGSRMVFIQRDKKFSTWNVDASMRLAEFSAKDNANEGILKMSRDGKYVVFANNKKFVEVWETDTGKLRHTFDQMDWTIGDVGFTFDSKQVFASGIRQQFFLARLEDGEVIKHESEAKLDKDRHVRVCNYGEDSWATVIKRVDTGVNEVLWETPKESGRQELKYIYPPKITGGNGYFAVFCGADFWVGPFGPIGEGQLKGFPASQTLSDLRIDTLTNLEVANYLWITTISGAEVTGMWHPQHKTLIPVSRKYDPYVMLLTAPDAKRMIEQSPAGRTVVHELDRKEFRSPSYRYASLVNYNSKQERHEAFEGLAKRWENRSEGILDHSGVSAYSELVDHIANYGANKRTFEEQVAYLQQMLEKYPDSNLYRLALASKYYHHGTEARGSGFAFRVTPEGWVTLEEYMEKAWEMLEPMLEEDHVPPEAFRRAIQVARYQNWTDEQLDPIIDRAMIQAPTYSLIWKGACFSKLPRWGGMPGDCEALAARVADRIGGKEGDLMYADIARDMRILFSWRELVEDHGFDKQRLLRGMLALCERAPDAYAENQALVLAKEFDDHATGHQVALLMKERNHTFLQRKWEWDWMKGIKALEWGLAETPPKK
ncbi:WD40 repeat domain-containing protein [Bremerella sp.]|uniref:WD40 repeat domain-containing protein n=1 Tax=Bremerella sp. TaxID=2795602 RepID=UPI00391C0E83